MSETKQYLITNGEPGPRGVETAAHGLVMVQPTMEGTGAGFTATLTDEEARNARRQGLTLEEVEDGQVIHGTEDRPAAGHINLDAPDAAEKLKLGGGKRSARRKADGDEDKPRKSGDDADKK